MDPKIAIGTSGWSYEDWVGPFYPEGTRPARFLETYALHFRTVEVDATFYAVPARSTFEGWKARTPEGFLFSLKVPGIVTHGTEGERYDPGKVLLDAEGRLEQFLEKAAILGEKLAAVVFQFPYFRVREFQKAELLRRLDAILSRVPPAVRAAVEIRNKSWIDSEVLSCLSGHRAAAVLIDHPYMPPPPDELHTRMVTTDFAYLRLLGDRYGIEKKTKRWDGVVEDKAARIEAWSRVLAEIAEMANVERVLAYSNNHFAGHAPATCRELASRLEGRIEPSAAPAPAQGESGQNR